MYGPRLKSVQVKERLCFSIIKEVVNETGEFGRGSGNFASDKDKEIARLKRQLRDAEGAIEVLKKSIGILSK